MSTRIRTSASVILMLAASLQAHAYDVTDNFSISGLIAAGGQCQSLSDDAGEDDACRGAMPVQPELSLRTTDRDEFFIKFGYGVGNGLNNRSPFALSTWAADLEDDVEDLNGRDRDYLLTAWYKHSFELEAGSLGLTMGIIDSTDYLDQSDYANDEFTQFMNEVFVNNRNSLFPGYDAGVALEWAQGNWSLNAISMNVGKNDNDNEFMYYGAQAGYSLNSGLGDGYIRLTIAGTNGRFINEDGSDDGENRFELVATADQSFGEYWGAFVRVGWQSDDPAIVYESVFSGGVDLKGGLWGRGDDNVGIGVAYMDGGNLELDRTYAFETYYRATLSEHLALTADVQWLQDENADSGDDDAEGWIVGLRLVAEF